MAHRAHMESVAVPRRERSSTRRGGKKKRRWPAHLTFTPPLSTSMSPPPYRSRDIVRVLTSVDQTLRNFFFDNHRLATIPGKASTADLSTPSNRDQSGGNLTPPGVVLDVLPDHANVAVFMNLKGKGLSDINGLLRHVIATIHPTNQRYDAAASGWLHSLAIYPTWRIPDPGQHSLCLCLRHKVSIDELKPWSWEEKPKSGGAKYRMCKRDFKILQQLCERNERLRGLFATEIRWLLEEVNVDDVMKRVD